MKRAILGIVLLNLIFTLACIRVHVEVLEQSGQGGERTPEPEKQAFALPELDPTKRFKTGISQATSTCARDRNATPAVPQETGSWCWAASTQGVLAFHGKVKKQCEIANSTLAEGRTDLDGTPHCCAPNAQCEQNAWPDEAFDKLGIDYKWVDYHLTPSQIAGQLCDNGPFIYSISYDDGPGGHTFVVKDWGMDADGEMSLVVDTHDPLLGFMSRPYDAYRDGWYEETDRTPSTLEYTYIQIIPQ